MKTTLSLVLSVTLGLLLGIADSSSQVRYTYGQLVGQTVVSNAIISASPEYQGLLKTVATEKASERLTPVHLYSCSSNRLDWCGTGTMYLQNNKGVIKEYIITSGHIFNSNRNTNLFFYRKVGEKNWLLYGVEKVFNSHQMTRDKSIDQDGEVDVAVAVLGPARPVSSFSSLPRRREPLSQFARLSDTNLVLTSLVKNKMYQPLLLVIDNPKTVMAQTFLVFDYKPIPGESGTGFLGSDGLLYVLMDTFLAPSVRAVEERLKEVGTPYTNGFSRAVAVKLGR